jgi:dihydrofolate reductase
VTPLPLALIAAVARNRVIGARNGLPWRLPSDLKHFRRTTMGKPVIMGRKTWDSIGRPLPGRFVIVVSRDPAVRPEGVEVVASVDAAIERAAVVGRDAGASEIMVAGGGILYAQTIGRAGTLHLTEVDLAPDGDTLFPPIDPSLWRETDRDPHPASSEDAADYAFVTYQRR